MKWPFVSRAQHEAALTEIDNLRRRVMATEARHDEVEAKRRRLAGWLAEAKTANTRLTGRIDELTKRIEERPSFEDSAALKNQIRHLQRRLDDAVGLTPGRRPEDSSRWQPGYQQPKPTKETTS